MGYNHKKRLVPPEEFVEAVMANRDISLIASVLDVSEASVRLRLKKYRKGGVKLPVIERRNGGKINVTKLNNLIRSYSGRN